MSTSGARHKVVVASTSPDRTRALGAALAAVLHSGDVVLLEGELGAGKTTLVQGLAAGLGVHEQVTSPTFTLVRPYKCEGREFRTLLHADLYRLEHLNEVRELALDELVEQAAVAVVEWGDRGEAVLGRDSLHVCITGPGTGPGPGAGAGDDERTVTVEFPAGRTDDERRFAAAVTVAPEA